MIRALSLAVLVLAGCDPIWSFQVDVRSPADRPIAGATLAVACPPGTRPWAARHAAATDAAGEAQVGDIGGQFPPGCDVYVVKPGYRTRRIRYSDLCPGGEDSCPRSFAFDLVLEPEAPTIWMGR
jgi:hypothetical protein